MAKKLLFCLLFASIQAFTFASSSWRTQFCDAPAPTNFEVISMASDLVTLGWDPSVTGATHTLELMMEENGAWVSLWVNPEVPGESIVLDNLEPGSYLARLATNCQTGEAGINVVDLTFEFKIIDLTTLGRIPKEPEFLGICAEVNYIDYKWIGFEVREKETNVSNVFEIKVTAPPFFTHAEVKQVYNSPIVAVDEFGDFPTGNNSIPTISPIRLDDKSKQNPTLGYIIINKAEGPANGLVVNICKDENNINQQWKSEYEFSVIVANDIVTDYPGSPNGSQDKSINNEEILSDVLITNPMGQYLIIRLPDNIIDDKITLKLLDSSGKQVFETRNVFSSISYIPTKSLVPGVYFLQIKTNQEFKTIKIFKNE